MEKNKILERFQRGMESVSASTSAGGSAVISEGTNVPKINMNSHANQGSIIFIPISDANHNPFLCSVTHEVVQYRKWNDSKTGQEVEGQTNRYLLEKEWYEPLTDEQSAKYDDLHNTFMSIYSNREMLNATDWGGSVSNFKYFGFYAWVISHTTANGVQIADRDGVPHQGARKEGRLCYVQFKSNAFINAWDTFVKQYNNVGQTPDIWVPRVFSRDEWRSTALQITYGQDPNRKFAGQIAELWFQTQLPGLVNNRAVNPNAYHVVPEWIVDAKDLGKEFMNTTVEGSLMEDFSVIMFEKAMRAVTNSFDYYSKNGAEAYSIYSESLGFNEVDQSEAQAPAALQPGQVPGAEPQPMTASQPAAAPQPMAMPQSAPTAQPVAPPVAPAATPVPNQVPTAAPVNPVAAPQPMAPTFDPNVPQAGPAPTHPGVPVGGQPTPETVAAPQAYPGTPMSPAMPTQGVAPQPVQSHQGMGTATAPAPGMVAPQFADPLNPNQTAPTGQ